jgi:hypothetical protein
MLLYFPVAIKIRSANRTKEKTLAKGDKVRAFFCFAHVSPRKFLLLFFSILIGLRTGSADEGKLTDTSTSNKEATPQLQYQIKVLSFETVEIGGPLLIGVYGSFADEVKMGLENDTETVRRNLKLYLNGVPMDGLIPVILPPEAAVEKANDARPVYVLQFLLDRNSDDDSNRKAWDSLLSRLSFGPRKLQAGVGLNGKVPHLTPTQALQFQVRDQNLIYVVIGFGILLFVGGMVATIGFGIVREAGPGTPYSLGKTQMAFWGILVAISFVAVWIIGHRMERIPPQVLVLLGISGVTGLGSVLIDKNRGQITSEIVSKVESSRSWRGWFTDIISDGSGVSFHRLQVVLWTLILGFVFAWTVANTFSMPEFENTLLVLMGISNGLYLGFKIPELTK